MNDFHVGRLCNWCCCQPINSATGSMSVLGSACLGVTKDDWPFLCPYEHIIFRCCCTHLPFCINLDVERLCPTQISHNHLPHQLLLAPPQRGQGPAMPASDGCPACRAPVGCAGWTGRVPVPAWLPRGRGGPRVPRALALWRRRCRGWGARLPPLAALSRC